MGIVTPYGGTLVFVGFFSFIVAMITVFVTHNKKYCGFGPGIIVIFPFLCGILGSTREVGLGSEVIMFNSIVVSFLVEFAVILFFNYSSVLTIESKSQ